MRRLAETLGHHSAEDLRKALSIIDEQEPSRGLRLNKSKSLLFVPKDDALDHNPIPSDIPIVRERFTLLGCPIGSPAFCAASVLERVKKVQEGLDLLPVLEDSQMAATLLRSCLDLSKLSFALRTCPGADTGGVLGVTGPPPLEFVTIISSHN